MEQQNRRKSFAKGVWPKNMWKKGDKAADYKPQSPAVK